MTESERLQSLKDFAEEKKLVRPGEDGTIPRGPGTMMALQFGGPLRSQPGGYQGHLAPPSYEAMREKEQREEAPKKSKNPVKQWIEKRRASKAGNDGEDDGVVR